MKRGSTVLLFAIAALASSGCKRQRKEPCYDTARPADVRYASCVEQCEKNKAACDLAEDLRPAAKQAMSAGTASPSPSGSAPAKPAGPVDMKRLAAAAERSISASDALRLRQLTHPTGKGGTLGDVKTTTSDTEVLVDIPVRWQGGFTSAAYETIYRWTLDDRGGSRLTVPSDTAVVQIDEPHRAAAESFMKTKRSELGL